MDTLASKEEKFIEELAYQLPINNIVKIMHYKNSFDRSKVLKYKVKLVKQVIKLIEKEISK